MWPRFASFAIVSVSITLWAQPVPPAGSCSNTSLTGNYGFILKGVNHAGAFTAMGQISTNGNGTIAGFVSSSSNGTISNSIELLGTYHIKSNCSGTVTITPAGQSALNFGLTIVSGSNELQLVELDKNTVVSGTAYAQGVKSCSLNGVSGMDGLLGGGEEIGTGPLVYGGQINLKATGTLTGSENGSVNGTIFTGAKISGAYKVGKRCFGAAVVTVGKNSPIHLNLVVANGEKTVLFIQIDNNSLSSGTLQR